MTTTGIFLRALCLLKLVVLAHSFNISANDGSPKLHYLTIEAENHACDRGVHRRPYASNHKAVYLKPGGTLRLDLCTAFNASIRIMGVFFFCTGSEITVEVSMDGLPIGKFSTPAHLNTTDRWKEFYDSGPIGELQLLKPGPHYIDLYISPNETELIEIDELYIGTTDNYTTKEILTCQLSCMDELNSPEVHDPKPGLAPATFIQHSFPTKCAERDNVNIALVHPTVQSYRITASYPAYNSMLNHGGCDYRNCGNINAIILWMIRNEPYDSMHNVLTDMESMELMLNASEPLLVKIAFSIDGKSKGLIDADIGSILLIKFKEIVHDFSIDMNFKGRHKNVSTGGTINLNKAHINDMWTIPDYTWSESEHNEIYLLFKTNQTQRVVLDYVALRRRRQRGKTVTTLYEDADTAIVGVNLDFWWRRPYTMNVTVEDNSGNQRVFENIDYIKLKKRTVGCCTMSKMFVLHQDGKASSVPPLIHGLNSVPFGSSFIIGPSNLTCAKPAADIRALHIYQVVPTLRFRVTYYDNSTASVEVSTKGLETEVLVSDIKMTTNRTETPFVLFRSMWVTNGNSNVDHFKTNRENGRPILAPWNNLTSTWAKFYRSCESKHLSKSPDMSIELLQ